MNAILRRPTGDESFRFAAARAVALHIAWFAPVLYRCELLVSDAIATAAVTSQLELIINPDQLAGGWSTEELGGVLLHEAHHVLRGHTARFEDLTRPAFEHRLWNLACDAAINDDLPWLADADAVPRVGEAVLPFGAVLPRHLGLPDGGAEEAYFWALHDRAEIVLVGDADEDACDVHQLPAALSEALDEHRQGSHDGPGGASEPVDLAELRREVRAAHTAATRLPGAARKADRDRLGDGAGHQELQTREATRPAVAWRQITDMIRTLSTRSAGWTPDYRRPLRRETEPGLLSASLSRPRPTLAVVLDTSASMLELLTAAVGEIDQLIRTVGAQSCTVICCDTAPSTPQRVRRVAALELTGGGGTDLRPGLAAAWGSIPRPHAVVVLTDGESPWPTTTAPIPTVVVLLGCADSNPRIPRSGYVQIPVVDHG